MSSLSHIKKVKCIWFHVSSWKDCSFHESLDSFLCFVPLFSSSVRYVLQKTSDAELSVKIVHWYYWCYSSWTHNPVAGTELENHPAPNGSLFRENAELLMWPYMTLNNTQVIGHDTSIKWFNCLLCFIAFCPFFFCWNIIA